MPDASPDRFPIRFDRAGRFATFFGIGPDRSSVILGAEDIVIRMGWAFHARIRCDVIRCVQSEPDNRPAARGAHGWRGEWLVNGSANGIVRLDIDPPARASTAYFPLKVHTLRVSLTDPDGFLDALQRRT